MNESGAMVKIEFYDRFVKVGWSRIMPESESEEYMTRMAKSGRNVILSSTIHQEPRA